MRNFHQAMTRGLYRGLMTAGAAVLPGRQGAQQQAPGQARPHPHEDGRARSTARRLRREEAIGDIKYDGKLTFDKETDVYYSGATHEESAAVAT